MKTTILLILITLLSSCSFKYGFDVSPKRAPAFEGISDPVQLGFNRFQLLEDSIAEGLEWPMLIDSEGTQCNIKNIIEDKIETIDLVQGDSGKTTKKLRIDDHGYSYVAHLDTFVFFVSAAIEDESMEVVQTINLLLSVSNNCEKTKIVDHGEVFDLYFKTTAFKNDLSKTITLVNLEKEKFGVTLITKETQSSPEMYVINLSNHQLERIIDFNTL